MRTLNLQTVCVPNDATAAAVNANRLRYELKQRTGGLRLLIRDRYYISLFQGPIHIVVGPDHPVEDLWIEGPGIVHGIDAPTPTTPVFVLERQPGRIPHIDISRLTLTSDGSVLRIVNGGVLCRLSDISINGWSGDGKIDYEGWSDLDTASYGLRIDDADTVVCDNVSIAYGTGHGVLATRWHCGSFVGRVGHNCGAGFKLQQTNGVTIPDVSRGESNWGYAVHARDCGTDRRDVGGKRLNESGAPNNWGVWCENNGRRGPTTDSAGFRYSQIKLDNCARINITGHSGATDNQIRGDRASLALCNIGGRVVPPLTAPTYRLTDIQPPKLGGNCNWDKMWPDEKFRPRWDATPDRRCITWPKKSFNNTSRSDVAYWRLFPFSTSPGTYVYRIVVQDGTGAIVDYCTRREQSLNRQPPTCCGFSISPVAGAIAGCQLWHKDVVEFTGSFVVDQPRNDISLSIEVWMDGMEESNGDQSMEQTKEHVLLLHEASLWKIS